MSASGMPSRPAVARAVSWIGAGHVVSQGLWLVSLLVLAALLPPRDFGTLAGALVLVNLAGLLVDSGTRGSLIAMPSLTRADVRGALVLNATVGLAATVVIAVLAGAAVQGFAQGGDVAAVRVLSLGVLLYALGVSAYALLQRNLRLREYAAANIGSAVVSSVVAVAAALLGAGVWALVARQLLSMGLLTGFAWVAARPLVPAPRAGEPRRGLRALRLRQPQWMGFFLLAAADFAVINSDVFVVGAVTDAPGLGLYALAFMLAFAPLTQIAWQVGRVLFPAAAATDSLDDVGRRTLVALRLMGLLLLPVLPVAIALAPVLPEIVGAEWEPMVPAFQLLLIAGVGQALVTVIGESLSGTGNVGFRARVNVVWALATIAALVVLVPLDGIRGAALAHVALVVPFAVAYAVWGARRLGIRPPDVARALAPVAVPVAAQAAVTASIFALALSVGVREPVAGGAAAVLGALVAAGLLAVHPARPLREGRTILAEALRKRS